jgi:hypothetical protein
MPAGLTRDLELDSLNYLREASNRDEPGELEQGGEHEQQRRGGRAQNLGEKSRLQQLGEKSAAGRHRDHEQAGETGLGGRRLGVFGDPIPLRCALGEASQEAGQIPSRKLLAEQRRGKASTVRERIRRRQAAIAFPVAAPRSSSAPSRASSTEAGPSSELTAAGNEARSERPALSESAIARAMSGSARSTARR